MSQWLDVLAGATYDGDVGAQSDGTVNVPTTALPNNAPWDSGGGVLGGYGAQVLDILKFGVGAASQAYQTNQLLDYKRFEATQGGVYQQGRPAVYAAASPNGFVISPLLMIMLGLGAVLLLKK